MDISIRPYSADDREAVVALSLRAWGPGHASMAQALGESLYGRLVGDWRATQSRDVRADLDSEEVGVWVAVVQDRVAGFVTVKLDHEERSGEIHMLGVDPERQGRGVGTALTDFATEHMRGEGMTVAMVETGGDHGHAAARATYAKAGFTPLPIVRYFKNI